MVKAWNAAVQTIVHKLMTSPRVMTALQTIHAKMAVIYGSQEAWRRTNEWLCRIVHLWLLIALGFLFGFIVSGEPALLMLGFICAIIVPVAQVKQLNQQLMMRKRKIQLELPKVINQFLLFVGAGESIQGAIIRCAEKGMSSNPLIAELKRTAWLLQNNQSFQQAMEQLNRNCSVHEVSIFVNTLLMNYKRGGEQLTAALRMLSNQLWNERKALAKTIGEEASAKLVFPMIMTFFAVLLVIGAPAVLFLNF